MISFRTVRDAFAFVSGAPYGAAAAFIDVETGRVVFHSETGGFDALPGDIGNEHKYLPVPHREDLALGRALAVDYVSTHLPDAVGKVDDIFKRSGADVSFKQFLAYRSRLDEWRAFSTDRETTALLKWCRDHRLPVDGTGHAKPKRPGRFCCPIKFSFGRS
jgi:hypothetical protein